MAKRMIDRYDPPETLAEHPFYGIELDEYQTAFRDAIWSQDKLIVFCNAPSGSGKTLIATATANLLCEYGRFIPYPPKATKHLRKCCITLFFTV